MKSEFIKRIISSIILLTIIFLSALINDYIFLSILFLAIIFSWIEWIKIIEKNYQNNTYFTFFDILIYSVHYLF